MKFKAAFLAALYAVMLFTADVSANETEINSKNFPVISFVNMSLRNSTGTMTESFRQRS